METLTFINCTPHAITIDGVGTIEPSGFCPRVVTARTPLAPLTLADGTTVRVIRQIPGHVIGMPPPQRGVAYIVSGFAAQALSDREDVFAPDTGADAIRVDGQVVSVRGLVKN